MRYPIVFALSLIMLNSAAQAAEGYYVWVDENGVTNYAEKSPEGYNARLVTKTQTFGRRTYEADDVDSRRPQPQQTQTAAPAVDPDALVEEEAARLAAEVADQKRNNCEIAKRNLAHLKAFARLRVEDENGQSRVLTDEEKEQRAAQARQTIAENCTSG